jgi:hypothetical protein
VRAENKLRFWRAACPVSLEIIPAASDVAHSKAGLYFSPDTGKIPGDFHLDFSYPASIPRSAGFSIHQDYDDDGLVAALSTLVALS